jgi:hypothetical protein
MLPLPMPTRASSKWSDLEQDLELRIISHPAFPPHYPADEEALRQQLQNFKTNPGMWQKVISPAHRGMKAFNPRDTITHGQQWLGPLVGAKFDDILIPLDKLVPMFQRLIAASNVQSGPHRGAPSQGGCIYLLGSIYLSRGGSRGGRLRAISQI